MDASRLLAVLADVEAEATSLVPVLTKLTQAYTAARDTPAQDPTEAIRQARAEVRALLASSVTNLYTPSRRQILEAIQGEKFVGSTAAAHIEALLAEASIGAAAALAALQAYVTELNQFRGTCSQARKGLTGLHVKPDALAADEAEVGILLPRSLTKGHFDELTRQLAKWNMILKGFTELAGSKEREVTVRMLSTGSDQVFLLTSISVALLLVPVIEKVLELYQRILDLRKARKELERLGAPVAEAEQVKAHEQKVVEDTITQLAKELMARVPPSVPQGRRGELENHLTISIRHVTRFVDQGGDVEVTVAPPAQEEYVPPADAAALTEGDLEQRKAEWAVVQEQKARPTLDLARKGAALAGLPRRGEEILQLPEPPELPSDSGEEDGQKEDKRKKK